MEGYNTKTVNKDSEQRYKNPYNNLLYAILIQAVVDNDIEFLRHGDGLTIWKYLKTQRRVDK